MEARVESRSIVRQLVALDSQEFLKRFRMDQAADMAVRIRPEPLCRPFGVDFAPTDFFLGRDLRGIVFPPSVLWRSGPPRGGPPLRGRTAVGLWRILSSIRPPIPLACVA
jgi:hypothetical protein